MLTAKIIKADGTYREYSEELIKFSWQTRNNEGASFSASIPTLTATFVLCKSDDFIKSLDRTSRVEISSDTPGGLTLPLSILEVTPLDRKGKTEISCSGNFFKQTNNIFGTLKIPAGDWETTQENYGLGMVELHENNPEVTVNVDKKEDIALGVAWGFNTRRNVSVTPFTTGDGSFSNDGIGLFKNVKEQVNDDTAPVYRIEAEDIIDYDIEPAQPPVTHIQTTTLGKLGPTPQIPTMTMTKYTDKDDPDYQPKVDDNARACYIEETQTAAVWHISENTDETIASQTLEFSDGVVVSWPTTEGKKQVIGIFDDAYVLVKNAQEIEIRSRIDSTVLHTIAIDNTSALWTSQDHDRMRGFKTNFISAHDQYTDMKDTQVLWFRHITPGGYIGIWYDGTDAGVIRDNSATYTDGDYYFVSSNKVLADASETQNKYYAQAIYSDVTTRKKLIAFSFTRNALGVATFVRQPLPDVSLSFAGYGTALDAISTRKTVSASAPVYIAWSYTKVIGGVATPMITIEKVTNSAGTEQFNYSGFIQARWAAESTQIGVDYATTTLLGIIYGGTWVLVQANAAGSTATALQRGNIGEWAGEDAFYFMFGRGVFMVLVYKGNQYWDLYLQMDIIPFLSRQKGEPMMAQKIADGNTNTVTLAFKVGALQQYDKNAWDEDKGRVEITLASFRVRNNSTKQWLEKSVQALNIIATAAYCRVQFDEGVERYAIIKTTGFSIDYEGDVTARLSGIIVEQQE